MFVFDIVHNTKPSSHATESGDTVTSNNTSLTSSLNCSF